MSDLKIIRLGTRGSPLALRQAEIVKAELARVRPDIAVETVIIKTSGDWTPEQGEVLLDRAGGGKALFAKELEEALLRGEIDAAVHSMKDMDSTLPEGLAIECMLPREDARDAVILREKNPAVRALQDLPENAVIGTCSLRRQGMILAVRPDIKIVAMRGNVGTRLQKLQDGIDGRKLDGIVLAMAGLNRLNMAKNASFKAPVEMMLPAAGQGAIGIETKGNSSEVLAVFSQINCQETLLRVKSERAALANLGGGCHTPVGVHAIMIGDTLSLQLRLVSPDGREKYEESVLANVSGIEEAEGFGAMLGNRLREKAPRELLEGR